MPAPCDPRISPAGQRRLLLLASKLGYQTRSFAQAADQLGVRVLFGTDRCHLLDDPWQDAALALHFESPRESADEIIRHFKESPPHAILALGDRATATAAMAAEVLGLPCNPPSAVEICRSKRRQREALCQAGLPVPDFFPIPAGANAEDFLASVTLPCVVKPVALTASQGVIRANDADEFLAAVKRIRALLESPEIQVLGDKRCGSLLVERYIPGVEVALEGLMYPERHGVGLRTLAIFDKPEPLEGPYFEETIYVTPSRLPLATQQAVEDCAARAISAIGLRRGPLHAEFRISDGTPWILELAPRPIGGLCGRALRFGPGLMSLEELLIRDALNLGGTDVAREESASGVMMIPVPRNGILEGVQGADDAERVPGITEIRITARLHDYIAAWPEGSTYLGFIFARAESPAAVETALHAAHQKLRFEFSPRLPVEHPITGRMTP